METLVSIWTYLQGKKTYITSALMIIAAIALFASGSIDAADLVQRILEALGISSLRAGFGK